MKSPLSNRNTEFLLVYAWILCFRLLFVATSETKSTHHKAKRNLLDMVLEDYDLDKWPTFHEDDGKNEPTTNTVSVDIMFISSINVEAMDLTIDMYLNQNWTDTRLRFAQTVSRRPLHLKTVEQMRRIWTPDTYIVNAKQANFHHITTENRVVYINGTGSVFYSARITAKVACEMKFHSFPMDNQECILHLASYAYKTDILQMVWKGVDPVSYKKNMDLNQFHLTSVKDITCIDIYPDGKYPCLKVIFKFERRVAHHLIQTFLPTVLIVTISWVSFYIQADAVPARISLGITTLLTMITLNSGTKQGLPPVSYVKAIDVWMGVCTFFVFSAIWEYVVVCLLIRRPIACQRHSNIPGFAGGLNSLSRPGRRTSSPMGSIHSNSNRFIRNSLTSLVIPNLHAAYDSDPYLNMSNQYSATTTVKSNSTMAGSQGGHGPMHNKVRQTSFHQLQIVPPTLQEEKRSNNNNGHCHLSPQLQSRRSQSRAASLTPTILPTTIRSDQVGKVVWEPRSYQSEPAFLEDHTHQEEFHLQTSPTTEQIVSRRKKKVKIQCICMSQARSAQERSKRVDIIARIAYPCTFLAFNLFYWPWYLSGMAEVPKDDEIPPGE